jgi:acyl-CoA thioesterase-1
MLRFFLVLLMYLPLHAVATPTILVYGDSLSAAYGIATDQGWVNLLQQRLNSQGYRHQVANASISGETSSGGLSRIATALRQHRPSLVILELGANDGLRGLPVAEMRHNLASIIEYCRRQGAHVLLVGMRIPPNYGPRYTREFSDSYLQLAKQYRLPLVEFLLDGVAGQRPLIQDDGLHPAAHAQPMLLDNVWKKLQPMLDKH